MGSVGVILSHLQGMFTRTIRLLEAGLKPPPDLKKQELANRYSKKADAAEDLQEAMEVFFFGHTWSDKFFFVVSTLQKTKVLLFLLLNWK
ncbi:hypothetical protein E1A91_D07G204900v1 [Gossypium mustelinum]|uniref:Uncharacterized protein n=1 Tax=Gossypium mustelinum TaxID=34275 RepID=A0A5D2UD08_GOSMU|nr:hypothetical protein E1A91_D07G204900v1 [Gossypium mustelinum]